MTKRAALGIVAGMGTTKTRPYECDEDRLQNDVRELKEELRVLRIAIDELRDDVVWAARQVLDAGHRVAGDLMPKRAPDPLAPDSNGHGPDPFPTAPSAPPPAVPAEEAPGYVESHMTSEVTAEPTAATPADDPKPAHPAVRNVCGKTATKVNRVPLYMRVYQDRVLTDIVRAIGYETLSGVEARRRLEPIGEKHGQERMALAMQEVIVRSSQGTDDFWKLSDDARIAARALLGAPPTLSDSTTQAREVSSSSKEGTEVRMTASSNIADAENNATAETACNEIKATRKIVLARFREHLNEEEESIVEFPADIQKLLSDKGRMVPDVALGEPCDLIAVRRSLSAAQRHDMAQWLEVSDFGDRAIRAWPRQHPDGWWWQYEVVAKREDGTKYERVEQSRANGSAAGSL